MNHQEIIKGAIKLAQEAEEELNKIQTKRLLKKTKAYDNLNAALAKLRSAEVYMTKLLQDKDL